MRDLFQILESELKAGNDIVLVTIVGSSGSTPRGEGAHMIVSKAGRICGTIGGGAVEHHGELVAQNVLQSKESHTEHFRLRQNQIQDLGMICGGDVNVCFQYIPANQESIQLCDQIRMFFDEKEEFWLFVDNTDNEQRQKNGGIGVCTESGRHFGVNISEAELKKAYQILGDKLSETSRDLKKNRKTIQIEVENRKLYCEKMMQTGKVYIFGGGHVSQALVPVLAAVSFRCIVLEDREEFCKPELFPMAEETVLIDNTKIADFVNIRHEDYVCIMTRGHKDDLTVQAQVLGTEAAYIGVIGSRHKKAGVFSKLKEQGFTDADLERVTTPIGLNIGAETPEEIAVSIAAQLIEKRAGR